MNAAEISLTVPQRRALQFVRDRGPLRPRALARLMWPDSPGWTRRSRRHATPAGGALGATMPMKAATILWRLLSLGVVYLDEHDDWTIAPTGERLLGPAGELKE